MKQDRASEVRFSKASDDGPVADNDTLQPALALAADPVPERRVEAARRLGQISGDKATEALSRLCTCDPHPDVVYEAALQLLTGVPDRVDAYLLAWAQVDDTVAGWMDNAVIPPLDAGLDPDAWIEERETGSANMLVREIAGEWLIAQGRRPVPPGRLPQ